MTFDIHQNVMDEDGGFLDEEKAAHYQEELMVLFEQSPEGQVLIEDNADLWWADALMNYGLNYLAETPPHMTAGDLRTVVFEIFPSKLSILPVQAPEAIRVLRAFWQFLKREYHLANADACLRVLEHSKTVERFERELSDPANFGIAKSMIMMGMARGFDISTEKGINKWMETYNAELAAGTGVPIPTPGEMGPRAAQARALIRQGLRRSQREYEMAQKGHKPRRSKKTKK